MRCKTWIIKRRTDSHHPRLAPCGSRDTQRNRSGYTLVFFAMLMFALMGLAALVIDIGFARLTQRQMQTAVDSAALEGLRFRDDPNVPEHQRDAARRQRASEMVAMIFDDDLDPNSGDDGAFYDAAYADPHAGEQFNVEGKFGAGPILNFTDGVGSDSDLAASEFINDPTNPNPNPEVGSYPETPVYKPTRSDDTPGLELNVVNEMHGDMVAGSFDATTQNVDFNPPGGDTNPAINEYSNPETDEYYVQRNFRPSAAATSNAFLVRMRRSNDFDGRDKRDNVSTHGPTVPFLFGRGSLLAVRDPDMLSDWLPRRHGMTVRATGIADVSNETEDDPGNAPKVTFGAVKTVGPTIPSGVFPGMDGVDGVTPFALSDETPGQDPVLCRVTHLTANVVATDTQIAVASHDGFPAAPFRVLIGNEIISVVDTSTALSWSVVRGAGGTTPADHSTHASVLLHQTLTIGVEVSSIAADATARGLSSLGSQHFRYVPVFGMVSGRQVVIGFREAESWTFDETTHRVSVNLAVGSRIIAENASAHILATTEHSLTWPPSFDVNSLIEINHKLDRTIFAPVSVR
ncbi:MAG: pilus assembly protein TadG-related protein [Planctomycetaceae bacterium]